MSDIVPLPPSLSQCRCRYSPNRHATDCAIAIAFDETPLKDRPEYREGRRFAAISWDFPLRIGARINVEVELDPIAVILKYADEYERFELERGYEEWEKPIIWLTQQIEQDCEPPGVWFGNRRLSRDSYDFEIDSEYPRWTPEDTARLNEALASKRNVDPNQGTLSV